MQQAFGRSATQPPLPPFYPLYARRFRAVSRIAARAVFHSVRYYLESPLESLNESKVVVYSNHPGFWDPLLLALLTGRIWPSHPVVSPIDAKALRYHKYFHGLGFFGLDLKSPAGLRRFTEVARASLEGPEDRCLAMTPEGSFTRPGTTPKLQRGLALALSGHVGPPVSVVPVAIDYRMGRHPRPEATLAVGVPIFLARDQAAPTLRLLHQELGDRLVATMEGLERRIMRGEQAIDMLRSR